MRRSLALPLRLLRRERGLIVRFTAASLGRTALTAASFLLVREFLGGALGEGGALWALAGLLLAVHLGAAALTYASQVSQQKLVKTIELGVMERLIRQLLGLSAGFFDRRTHGDLIQAVRQDVTQLRAFTLAAARIFLDSLQAAGLVATAVVLSPTLALCAFVVVPLAAGPVVLIARRTLARSYGVRRGGVVLFDVLLQLFAGIRTVKLYNGEQAEAGRAVDRARRYFDELIAMERVRALSQVVMESLAGLSLVAVVIVGGFQVMRGALGWPELLAFLMAARAAQGPLAGVNAAYMEIQRNGASVEHIDALLRERPEVRDRPDARPLARGPESIAARGVSFSVRDEPVLREVSFEVRAGETLGVVGPSGAGKTTLLNLVARFYDPDAGEVRFGDTDVRALRLADVQGSLAMVTQDPFLFNTSVRDNIRCGRPGASDAEVEAAARAAEIHDEVAAMPGGYDTVVGHGGRALSRGEAQRVNIARAILKDAPVLLLDEATSSLDSHTEAKVQRAIDRLGPGRLTISVAHRLSTLRSATRILVLENGRVVGLGAHAELLVDCPTYRLLWEAQAEAGPREAAVR